MLNMKGNAIEYEQAGYMTCCRSVGITQLFHNCLS